MPEELSLPRATAVRLWWHVAAPLLAAGLTLRVVIPGRSDIGPGPWGLLARVGDQHPVLLAAALFFVFAFVVRQFQDLLPGARDLVISTAASRAGWVSAWPGTAALLIFAAFAAVVLRVSVGQPYRVTSGSMLPTLVPSDDVFVNKLAFGLRLPARRQRLLVRSPARGEIAVFRATAVGESPRQSDEPSMLVKRVIGLPGDRITMQGGLVSINGWRVPTCDAGKYIYIDSGRTVSGRLLVEFLDDRSYLTLHTPEARAFDGYVVGAGEVFVLGDNRNDSRDSRHWKQGRGAGVPAAAFEGRAARIIAWDREGRLDFSRVWRAPGLDVRLPGMDTGPLQASVQRCLALRPANTSPPASSQ